MKKRGRTSLLFAAAATLTGTAIGAGFLGIPYVVAKSGFLVGLIHLVVLALIILLVNLYIGEIILRTKKVHQLPGYASIYLGKWARVLMIFAMLFGVYAAIIAYFIGEGQVLSFIFTGTLEYSLMFSIGFFAIISYLVFFGIEALKKGETIGIIAVFVIMLTLAFIFLQKLNMNNLTFISDSPIAWFLPYGVILFSFLSFSALPEVKMEIKNNGKLLKKAIVIGALTPLIAYILFTAAVVGFTGQETPEIATIALGKIPSLLAVFTMFTACFALSNAVRDMYKLDLKLKHTWAWALTIFIPFIAFLLITYYKIAGFVTIIEWSGAISGGLTGILAVLMLIKAKKLGDRKPEYKVPINWFMASVLILIFALGIIYLFLF